MEKPRKLQVRGTAYLLNLSTTLSNLGSLLTFALIILQHLSSAGGSHQPHSIESPLPFLCQALVDLL